MEFRQESIQAFSPKIELDDMNEKLQPGHIHNFLDLQLMKIDKEEISDQSENNDLDAMIRGVFEDIDEASDDDTGADAQTNHDQGYPGHPCGCGWIFSRTWDKLEHEVQCPAMHAPAPMWRPWSSALS